MKRWFTCVSIIVLFALLILGAEAEAPVDVLHNVFSMEKIKNAVGDTAIVRKLHFQDTLESAPDGYWDVSAQGDRSVRAWRPVENEYVIAAEGDVRAPSDCSGMFQNFSKLEIVAFNDSFDTSACENMRCMFKNCPELWYLHMEGIDTSNVVDMSEMFAGCVRLDTDLEEFDTSSVTNFEGMFRDCKEIMIVSFSGFQTSAATNMREMFAGCNLLRDISNFHFDTSNVRTMERMFQGCEILVELDMSGFERMDGAAVDSMFAGCEKLERLYVGDGFIGLEEAEWAKVLADCPAEIVAVEGSAVEPGVLRCADGGEETVLGSSHPRDVVRSVRFLDDLSRAPEDAWDVSARGDASVMAWFADGSQAAELVIAADGGVSANPNSARLFWNYSSLEEIQFNGCFDTNMCVSMREMFYHCKSLRAIDLSGWNSSRVVDMQWMFSHCVALEELDVTPLNTSSVKDMFAMFYDCASLRRVDVSEMDTSSATNIAGMFGDCGSLEELNLSNFDTSSVERMYALFEGCEKLRRVDMSNFHTSQTDELREMFCDCTSLEELNLASFETAQVLDWSYMFDGCENLRTLYVGEGFVIAEDAFTNAMYNGCSVEVVGPHGDSEMAGTNVKTLAKDVPSDEDFESGEATVLDTGLPRWAVRSITFLDDLSDMPGSSYDVSDSGLDDVRVWWEYDGGLCDVYIAGVGGVWANPDSSYLFYGYMSLEEINFNGCFHTEQATDMMGMFEWCISLRKLDLSGFDTSRVQSMAGMFMSCVSLEELDVSGFDTSQVEDMSYMFGACGGLEEVDVTSFDTAQVMNMEGMFLADNLKRLDLRGFDTARVNCMNMMFFNCNALEEIQTSESFVIGEGVGVEQMFYNCPAAGAIILNGTLAAG